MYQFLKPDALLTILRVCMYINKVHVGSKPVKKLFQQTQWSLKAPCSTLCIVALCHMLQTCCFYNGMATGINILT